MTRSAVGAAQKEFASSYSNCVAPPGLRQSLRTLPRAVALGYLLDAPPALCRSAMTVRIASTSCSSRLRQFARPKTRSFWRGHDLALSPKGALATEGCERGPRPAPMLRSLGQGVVPSVARAGHSYDLDLMSRVVGDVKNSDDLDLGAHGQASRGIGAVGDEENVVGLIIRGVMHGE
jgi:hypothetical protein